MILDSDASVLSLTEKGLFWAVSALNTVQSVGSQQKHWSLATENLFLFIVDQIL